MNTRQPIQASTTPAVLSLSFSASRNRFTAGTSEGVRVFRTENCLTTYQPSPTVTNTNILAPSPLDGSISIAETLDDRYIAFVCGGRLKARAGRESVVTFYDCLLERELQRFDFSEPVLGVRVGRRWMVVVLKERSVVFAYQEIQQSTPPPEDEGEDAGEVDEEGGVKGPNKVHALHPTSPNASALACLTNSLLILPAQAVGQIQLIPLPSGSKRVLRAHNSALRYIALSPSGNLLATTSEQGTLIRVFDVKTLDQVAEFRRGVEKAIIFSLVFSDGDRWLACTSDKGTIHVFDLRPPAPSDHLTAASREQKPQHWKSQSYAGHRLSGGSGSRAPESLSSAYSGRSSPTTATQHTAGSIQEYYSLRPIPSPVSPSPSSSPPAVSAFTTFKQSSWAPKVLKDVRSVASCPFHMGEEGPYWQGGAQYSWTTMPGGGRKRVKNPVMPLPGEPSGQPPKGLVAFEPRKHGFEGEEHGAVIYVVGGGTDARWEVFDLVGKDDGGWALVKRGFRKFLTRQFVD